MLSAGIVRSDNALVVSFVKLFLFPNLLSCILFAWTCFFIATISTGPSSWGDPLPTQLYSGEGEYSRDTRYLAFLLVKRGRGGEIVGNPYAMGKGGSKQELPYTGLEGYYAGSERTP